MDNVLHPIDTPQALPMTPGLGLAFSRSRWLTRGWTLQELIAPRRLEFFDSHWKAIGENKALATSLQDITGIDTLVIEGGPLEQVSVARRMSWAANRETTRQEDIAYSLFGIYGVNMPLVYGEGPKAFLRLQEEILKTIRMTQKPITITNKGIQITGRVHDIREHLAPFDTIVLVLNCCFEGDPLRVAGIYLRRQDEGRYARIRPDELASINPQGRHITQLTLYGLRQDAEIRGHHYDQPWTTSYQIRLELADSDLPQFGAISAARRKYEDAFYIQAKSLKQGTVFGLYKLHGVLITDSHGLLRFFSFDPDTRHLDMVLKTYDHFRAMLLFKPDGRSDWILIILGRKPADANGSQLWMDAIYLMKEDHQEDSSRLLKALKTCKENVTNSQIDYLNISGSEQMTLASLAPKRVEGILMSEVRLSGPWPTNILYTVWRNLKAFIFRVGIFILLTGGIGSIVDYGSLPPDLWNYLR
nr:HET-domain containing protein [Trichoderma balearicum]